MSKTVELTGTDGGTVWVVVQNLLMFFESPNGGTRLMMAGEEYLDVEETPLGVKMCVDTLFPANADRAVKHEGEK